MKKLMIAAAVGVLFVLILIIATAAVLMMQLSSRGNTAEARPPANIPGLSPVLLKAYQQAVDNTESISPGCRGVRWQILAGIGHVESHNAAGRTISAAGDVTPPIIGPALTGSGAGGNTTVHTDTDNGVWDHNTHYDAAVGVLQFIPSTWRILGQDANNDSIKDPHNVFDNAAAAVKHLCGTSPTDLTTPAALREALYNYNHSTSYVDKVTDAIAVFDTSTLTEIPDHPGTGTGATIVAEAKRWIGWPYSWGGGNPRGPSFGFCCSPGGSSGAAIKGFDCSGLTLYAAAQVGISLPHNSEAQSFKGQEIPPSAGVSALRPGDLVFFGISPNAPKGLRGIHHVGIYVGGGQMINAPRPGRQVTIEPLWMDEYAGGTRLA